MARHGVLFARIRSSVHSCLKKLKTQTVEYQVRGREKLKGQRSIEHIDSVGKSLLENGNVLMTPVF